MKVGFITEANQEIGYGHLYRIIAIAHGLRKEKSIAGHFFFSSKSDKIDSNFLNSLLLGEQGFSYGLDHVKKMDKIFVDVAPNNITNIIDQAQIRNLGIKKTLIMDDSFQSFIPDAFDYVFNVGFKAYKRKARIVKNNSREVTFFSGSDYLVLREEFSKDFFYSPTRKVRDILLSMGGSDSRYLTEMVLESMKYTAVDAFIHIVLGRGVAKDRFERIEKIAKVNHLNFKIYHGITEMSELMCRQDLAIINGGNTRFELASIGVPFISIPITDIQKSISDDLASQGIGINLERFDNLQSKDIAKSIDYLANDFILRSKMSKEMKAAVSNCGVQNILKELF